MVARDFGGHVVSTDDYVIRQGGDVYYSDRLAYDRLEAGLQTAFDDGAIVVIEGICLRDTLRQVRVQAVMFIYVKRLGTNGLWHDGLHLEDFESGQAITENHQEPHVSDFRYHNRVRPHELATVVFHRLEPDLV